MKIKKTTFKNKQAWLTIESESGEYLGTLHVVHPGLAECIQKEAPTKVIINSGDIMTEKKYARKCDECGKVSNEGYCIEGGEEYYCSDKCLHKNYSKEEFKDLHATGDSYWTQWEDKDEMQYYADGTEMPLCEECENHHPLNRCGNCGKESLNCPCYECLSKDLDVAIRDNVTNTETIKELLHAINTLMDIAEDCYPKYHSCDRIAEINDLIKKHDKVKQ